MASYPVRCAVTRPAASAEDPKAATLTFTEADGVVASDAAPPIEFDLADLVAAEPGEGEMRLALPSGLLLRLTALGRIGPELVARLQAARRDRTAYAFRFGSAAGDHWDDAEVLAPGASAARRSGLRLFGSLLGVVPDRGEPQAIPYGDVRGVAFDAAAYQVVVDAAGGTWRIGRLAKRSTPFVEALKRAVLDLGVRYQAQLKDVMPHIGGLDLQQLSGDWREGIALPAEVLGGRDPGAPARLLGWLPSEERRRYVEQLSAYFGRPPRLGFYYSAEAAESGTRPFEPFALFEKTAGGRAAVAWEVLGEMGTATYVFRGADADLAGTVNRALRAIRFAREPVYLPEGELLTTGAHRHLVPLLGRSDELKLLRRAFAGRLLHTEPEAYGARLAALCEGRG
jgi:hypothetical protein